MRSYKALYIWRTMGSAILISLILWAMWSMDKGAWE